MVSIIFLCGFLILNRSNTTGDFDETLSKLDASEKSIHKITETCAEVSFKDDPKSDFHQRFLYEESPTIASKKTLHSRIPKSPMLTRRRSMDNCSSLDNEDRTDVQKSPVYRSIRLRKSRQLQERSPLKDNTWNGRSSNSSANVIKHRPTLTAETFKPPLRTASLTRNTPARVLQHIDGRAHTRSVPKSSISGQTSPKKGNNHNLQSQLALELMDAAGNGRNDTQILGKIKQILSEYSPQNKMADELEDSQKLNCIDDSENSAFSVECKLTSTKSDSNTKQSSRDLSSDVSTRRRTNFTKIPAPVRSKTGLF
jgi:hypothetical protein